MGRYFSDALCHASGRVTGQQNRRLFNFTVAAPQIVSGLTAGWILCSVFDNEAKYIIVVAGASMLLGAIAVFFVKEHDVVEADVADKELAQ